MNRLRHAAAAALLGVAGAAAAPAGVTLAGRLGDRALLVIDGQARTVAVGQVVAGVRLLRWSGDSAEIERDGRVSRLQLGGTPTRLGADAPLPSAREVVISAGPGGHYTAGGAINGHAVRFLVDTGATLVSIGRSDAERLGIDLKDARNAVTQTANGPVAVQLVTLNAVRVGDLELANVGAAVVPAPMPLVLLGNSFLSRLQIRLDNNVLRLEQR